MSCSAENLRKTWWGMSMTSAMMRMQWMMAWSICQETTTMDPSQACFPVSVACALCFATPYKSTKVSMYGNTKDGRLVSFYPEWLMCVLQASHLSGHQSHHQGLPGPALQPMAQMATAVRVAGGQTPGLSRPLSQVSHGIITSAAHLSCDCM